MVLLENERLNASRIRSTDANIDKKSNRESQKLTRKPAQQAPKGLSANAGVIIKSGDALEKMGKVDCIAFDKTGTLTHGNLVVSDVISVDSAITDIDLLRITASAESYSEHPLGKAIVAHAKEKKQVLMAVEDFLMMHGKGISGTVNGDAMLFGNSTYLKDNGVSVNSEVQAALDRLRKQGKATILVSKEKECIGVVALSDTLRSTARDMIQELKKIGTDAVLLTGDHAQTADYFASQAGIVNVHSELLPEQKVACIRNLQSGGHSICMIGDGVNRR